MPVVDQPKSKGGFALGDYVEVKDRIKLFYAAWPDGRLVTDRVEIWQDDEVPRIVVRALAYRTIDDPHPGVGWSWMGLPGTTNYTRGSELENTETSAWGRAIGSLGIALDKSIASADEIRGKSGEAAPAQTTVEQTEGGLIGVASVGKSSPVDGEMRETPQGMSVGFVIGEGRDKVQVVAYGALANILHASWDFMGKRVQVYGPVEPVTMRVGNYDRKFLRVTLERIATPDWVAPAPSTDSPVKPEALPIAMFDNGTPGPDADEEAAILALEMAEASNA
jgi:hypothetical protein